MIANKNLEEDKLYQVHYKGLFGNIKVLVGYLHKIELDKSLVFSVDIDYGWDTVEIELNSIIKIKELKTKGEAIEVKAE